MPDLRERLMGADRLPAPDLWTDVEQRLIADTPEAIDPRTVRELVEPSHRPLRKVLPIAAAFLIVALAFGWILQSLGRSERPAATPRPKVDIFSNVHGWIAYLGSRTTVTHRLMAADPTDQQRPIAIDVQVSSDFSAPMAWSSDGTELLLRDGELVRSDGTIAQIGTKREFQGGSFSPDGSQVAYSTYGGRIYVANADGSAAHLISTWHGKDSYLPGWAPDGSRIAFITRARSSEGHWTISSMDVDGGSRSVIVDLGTGPGEVGSPAWSPDGSRIALAINPDSSDTHRSAIWTIRADGTQLSQVTPSKGAWSPTWSPDGQLIAFVQGSQIVVMDATGRHARPLPRALRPGYPIAWNPAR